jgi:hypothetical protein
MTSDLFNIYLLLLSVNYAVKVYAGFVELGAMEPVRIARRQVSLSPSLGNWSFPCLSQCRIDRRMKLKSAIPQTRMAVLADASARRPAAQARRVGFGAGLVEEDQSRRIKPALMRLPAVACARCRDDPARPRTASFFEAQPRVPNHAPHRTIARHHAALAQFGNRRPQLCLDLFVSLTPSQFDAER